jgi:hypothetical protein
MMVMNSLRVLFLVGCLAFAGGNLSYGYVINGPKILQLVAHKIGRADTLLVNQDLVTYFFEPKVRRELAKEAVRYDFPNIFRSDLTSEGVSKFFLAKGDRTLSVINNQVDPDAESELDLYHFLLLHHHKNGLINFLETFGIDTNIRSLGKFEKEIAYVIGARYPDEDHSQLWIKKETSLPMRWLLVTLPQPNSMDLDQTNTPSKLERLEFRFSLWQKFDRLYYPMRLDILHNGILIREIRVNDVIVNPELDNAMMDIDQQKTLYPKVRQSWIEPDEEDDIDDIQKTIDDFKKRFE